MLNKNNLTSRQAVYFLSLSSLILLCGCWHKQKNSSESATIDANDQSVVLLKINGTPEITVDSLDKDIKEIASMDQQLQMMMMFNPQEMTERFYQEKKRMAIIKKWALENGIRNSEEYRNKRAKIMNHVDMQLDFEQFLNKHAVEVLDEDILKYYNENKEQDPRILVSPAGVKSQAVEFSDHKQAQAFYHKLQTTGAQDLEKLAQAQKYNVRNLGNVNQASYIDQAVKDAVAKVTKYPSVLLVENEDKTKSWVVVAQAQEAAKYHDFERVKDALKQLLSSKAIGEMLEVKIPEYAKNFDVVENEAYFNELRSKKQDLMQDLIDAQDENNDNTEQE